MTSNEPPTEALILPCLIFNNMWLAIFITLLAASGNNIGKVLQKQATRNLPKLTLKQEVLEQYLRSRTWLGGLLIDLGGALLMVVAFSLAPVGQSPSHASAQLTWPHHIYTQVSLVQPVSSIGLVVLLVFSHFYLEERLKPKEWTSAGIAFLGVLGLGLSGEGGGKPRDHQEPSPLRILLCFLLLLLLLGVECYLRHYGAHPALQKALGLLGSSSTSSTGAHGGGTMHSGGSGGALNSYSRHVHSPSAESWVQVSRDVSSDGQSSSSHATAAVALDSALCGLEAGTCFGLSAAASRTGFILAQRLKSPIWIVLGLGSSIGLSSSGFILQTKGLKAGNTVVVCTMAAVSSMVSGVAAGLLALGEQLPKSPLLLIMRLCSWLLILGGTGSLAGGIQALKPMLLGLSLLLPSLPPPGQGWLRHLPPRFALMVRRTARNLHLRVRKGTTEEGGSADDEEFEEFLLDSEEQLKV
jgi:drug/metabolite transporter (DMT)-like permease